MKESDAIGANSISCSCKIHILAEIVVTYKILSRKSW
jgi:hypothetical protein